MERERERESQREHPTNRAKTSKMFYASPHLTGHIFSPCHLQWKLVGRYLALSLLQHCVRFEVIN